LVYKGKRIPYLRNNYNMITPEQAHAFYEEHKHLKGKDYRLEILKHSKEDVYDLLDNIHQDNIFEWIGALGSSRRLEASRTEMLKEANEIIRSLYSVVKRKGEETNWEAIDERLKDILHRQHQVLLPHFNPLNKTELDWSPENYREKTNETICSRYVQATGKKESSELELKELLKAAYLVIDGIFPKEHGEIGKLKTKIKTII